MKRLACTSLAFTVAFIVVAFTHYQKAQPPFNISRYKAATIVRCSPDWTNLQALLNESDIPPMPGAGTYQWRISTQNDSAQFYFNQGINMYYGFHIIEALASFKKAARFDPENAMVWWAQALAYGPNINDAGYAASPDALSATQKAVALAATANPKEKAFIAAMQVRYSSDSTQKREKLNEDYAAVMKTVYEQYPANAEAAALYADALMLQHPWDLWYADGKPKAWTPVIQTVLEKLLVQSPNHPGANHYYIHLMEASPYAAKAWPSADRLGKLTPGLAHMVHMPSHIYLRTGQFNKGSSINEEAVKQFRQYASLFPAVKANAYLYQWHNLHMQANCAIMAGRYAYGIKTALDLQQQVDTSLLSLPEPFGPAVQYIYMTPALVNVHFGKWESLLEMQPPAAHHVYARILHHFAKGMAYAGQGNTTSAQQQLQHLQMLLNDKSLAVPMGPFSPPVEGAKVARAILQGAISMKEKNTAAAITSFTDAVETEGNMVYNEPRDWLLNPKQYLGAAYLLAGQWQNAENTFKKDLNQNVQNVWSLYGLQKALVAQQKNVEANIIQKQWEKATAMSDISFSGLFF